MSKIPVSLERGRYQKAFRRSRCCTPNAMLSFQRRERLPRVLVSRLSLRKIKQALIVPCVIVGYQAHRSGVHRLCVATVREEGLRYVGQLTRGFSASQGVELEKRLAPRQRMRPVTPCPHRVCWVEPELYCRHGAD
jgi:hypothetical protein